jgi:hypothetical protein
MDTEKTKTKHETTQRVGIKHHIIAAIVVEVLRI